MAYPTPRRIRKAKAKRPRKRPRRSRGRRRASLPPPEIYVKADAKVARAAYDWPVNSFHRAHLRNRKGYVYLCWREGKKIRTFYLGKAPRSKIPVQPEKSPTPRAPGRTSPADLARPRGSRSALLS